MPKPTDLSQDEVFENDLDPIAAIAAIRRKEGVPEDEIIVPDETPEEDLAADGEQDGDDELDNLDAGKDDTDDADEDDTDAEASGDEELDADDTDDADPDSDDDDDEAETDVSKDKPATVSSKKFKANGQEFEFTAEEVNEQFEVVFGQAMNYTQKMQAIAPYRKMISALESEDVTQDQLNLALDALKGNKDAIGKMLADNKIDPYDLTEKDDDDDKEAYSPTDYGKNDVQLGIDEITSKISGDEEFKITKDVIDNQWDNSSRESFASNPDMIQGLHNDIKSGTYDKVAPVAMKMKVMDGNTKSDLEYYMLAGQKVQAAAASDEAEKTVADKNKKAQDVEDDFDEASSVAQKKRAATKTRGRSDRKGVIDYLADDDEEFDAWYKNLEASN
jgi:hypothetical protein